MVNNMVNNMGSQQGHCCFNGAIDCTISKCMKCGWNPKVAEERVKNFLSKRAGKVYMSYGKSN